MKKLFDEIKADLIVLRSLTEKINELEEKRGAAIGLIKIGIWGWNLDDNSLDWDKKMYDIFELNPGEFAGTYEAFEPLVHPEDLEKMKETISQSLKSRESFEYLHRIKTSSGWKWIKGWGRTLFDKNNQPVKMIGACIEI